MVSSRQSELQLPEEQPSPKDQAPVGRSKCVTEELVATSIHVEPWASEQAHGPAESETSLCIAAATGNLRQVQALLECEDPGPAVNARDDDGNSALIWAAEKGHIDIVKYLLGVPGIDLYAQGLMGNTALARCARHGHAEVAKLLLEKTNERDEQGAILLAGIHNSKQQYPLHVAAAHDHIEVLQLLLRMKADVAVMDHKGHTPADAASGEMARGMLLAARAEKEHLAEMCQLLERTEAELEIASARAAAAEAASISAQREAEAASAASQQAASLAAKEQQQAQALSEELSEVESLLSEKERQLDDLTQKAREHADAMQVRHTCELEAVTADMEVRLQTLRHEAAKGREDLQARHRRYSAELNIDKDVQIDSARGDFQAKVDLSARRSGDLEKLCAAKEEQLRDQAQRHAQEVEALAAQVAELQQAGAQKGMVSAALRQEVEANAAAAARVTELEKQLAALQEEAGSDEVDMEATPPNTEASEPENREQRPRSGSCVIVSDSPRGFQRVRELEAVCAEKDQQLLELRREMNAQAEQANAKAENFENAMQLRCNVVELRSLAGRKLVSSVVPPSPRSGLRTPRTSIEGLWSAPSPGKEKDLMQAFHRARVAVRTVATQASSMVEVEHEVQWRVEREAQGMRKILAAAQEENAALWARMDEDPVPVSTSGSCESMPVPVRSSGSCVTINSEEHIMALSRLDDLYSEVKRAQAAYVDQTARLEASECEIQALTRRLLEAENPRRRSERAASREPLKESPREELSRSGNVVAQQRLPQLSSEVPIKDPKRMRRQEMEALQNRLVAAEAKRKEAEEKLAMVQQDQDQSPSTPSKRAQSQPPSAQSLRAASTAAITAALASQPGARPLEGIGSQATILQLADEVTATRAPQPQLSVSQSMGAFDFRSPNLMECRALESEAAIIEVSATLPSSVVSQPGLARSRQSLHGAQQGLDMRGASPPPQMTSSPLLASPRVLLRNSGRVTDRRSFGAPNTSAMRRDASSPGAGFVAASSSPVATAGGGFRPLLHSPSQQLRPWPSEASQVTPALAPPKVSEPGRSVAPVPLAPGAALLLSPRAPSQSAAAPGMRGGYQPISRPGPAASPPMVTLRSSRSSAAAMVPPSRGTQGLMSAVHPTISAMSTLKEPVGACTTTTL